MNYLVLPGKIITCQIEYLVLILGVKGMNKEACMKVYLQNVTFIFKSNFFLGISRLAYKIMSPEMNICDRILTLPPLF